MLQISTMRPEDIPFATKLTDQEKWGVTHRDLARILKLDPRGSFIAKEGSRKVGLITTTTYDPKLAWIGNVIVDRKHRGENIGRTLVENAIDYLQESGLEHIAVYCFDENVEFYRSLGFVTDAAISRLLRKPKAFRVKQAAINPGRKLPLRGVFWADRKAFGADRSKLIRMVLTTRSGWYLGYSNSPSASSYILVKEYKDMCELGPWICIKPPSGQPIEMLRLVLAKTARKPIEVSCLRNHRKAFTLFKKTGFEVVNHGYRMYFGKVPRIGDFEANYALGFLDKG